jgi:hypothetical protein
MKTRETRHILATAVLAAAFGVSATSAAFAQAAEVQAPPPSSSQAVQVPEQAPNLDRIRERDNRPSQLNIDNGRMRIYVEVIAKWPRFDELVKNYDLKNGPTPRGAVMTHGEFLQMVTPREMYSSAGIRPTEMLQIALTNWVGKALIKKGLEAISNARSQREIDEIRARIDRELAALRGR